jgi:hypothetical protein
MQLKSTILPVLGRRTLKRIVDALEIDVDRRSAEAMRAALSRSRRVAEEDLLHHMLKEEIKVLCGEFGLSGDGRREELLERLKSLRDSVTQGLDDGSRIKSHKSGWVVVDRNGLFLADPHSATWVMSPRGKQMPPAVFPTAAAAYLAWIQSQEVAKGRTAWPPTERSQSAHGT